MDLYLQAQTSARYGDAMRRAHDLTLGRRTWAAVRSPRRPTRTQAALGRALVAAGTKLLAAE